MSHCVTYMEFDESATKKDIYAEREMYIIDNGDYDGGHLRSSDNGFTLHPEIICANIEEAHNRIDALDRGWYDDHGVKFYDVESVSPTKKMIELKERIDRVRTQKKEYEAKHHINKQKAKFITCPKCGSKISNEMWHNNECPICRTDMRSAYILEKLAWYDEKIKKLKSEYKEAEKKLKSKAKVKWLVKLEFHV